MCERLRGGCPKIKLFKQNFSSLKGGNKKFQSQALGIEPYMLQNTVNFLLNLVALKQGCTTQLFTEYSLKINKEYT